ncbi:unnamed protein product [Diamesa hyperborea]
MKFAVAGLLVALAVCASGSAIPYGAWPYGGPAAISVANHGAPWGAAPYAAAPWAGAPWGASPYVASAPWAYSTVAHAPWAHQAVIAAPAVVHAPIGHAATYTAANRGSVHTAPLPGHALSQASLNLAPAPGTL